MKSYLMMWLWLWLFLRKNSLPLFLTSWFIFQDTWQKNYLIVIPCMQGGCTHLKDIWRIWRSMSGTLQGPRDPWPRATRLKRHLALLLSIWPSMTLWHSAFGTPEDPILIDKILQGKGRPRRMSDNLKNWINNYKCDNVGHLEDYMQWILQTCILVCIFACIIANQFYFHFHTVFFLCHILCS